MCFCSTSSEIETRWALERRCPFGWCFSVSTMLFSRSTFTVLDRESKETKPAKLLNDVQIQPQQNANKEVRITARTSKTKIWFHCLVSPAVMALSGSAKQTSSVARASGVTPVSVIFTSMQSTFTADLRDPSSAAFMERSSMIQAQASLPSNGAFCAQHPPKDPEAPVNSRNNQLAISFPSAGTQIQYDISILQINGGGVIQVTPAYFSPSDHRLIKWNISSTLFSLSQKWISC